MLKTVGDRCVHAARYLSRMRELYLVQGAMYEISSENKVKLGLSDPGKWSVDLLRTVQTAVGESLLLYWSVCVWVCMCV